MEQYKGVCATVSVCDCCCGQEIKGKRGEKTQQCGLFSHFSPSVVFPLCRQHPSLFFTLLLQSSVRFSLAERRTQSGRNVFGFFGPRSSFSLRARDLGVSWEEGGKSLCPTDIFFDTVCVARSPPPDRLCRCLLRGLQHARDDCVCLWHKSVPKVTEMHGDVIRTNTHKHTLFHLNLVHAPQSRPGCSSTSRMNVFTLEVSDGRSQLS